jgi:hypothetical protein
MHETLAQHRDGRASISLNSLVRFPTAPPIEVDSGTLVGRPNLVEAVPACPLLNVAEEKTPQPTASTIRTDNHAEQPRRAIAAFGYVEPTETHGT